MSKKKKSKKTIVKKVIKKSEISKHFSPFGNSFWKKNLIQAVILIIFGFGLYIQSYNFDYVLDDKLVITENNYVKNGFSGIKDILTHESFQGYFDKQQEFVSGARYRPLSLVTFAIEYEFFGLNSSFGHVFNIILYIIGVLLLFRVLSLLFYKKNPESSFLTVPFIAALIFLLHPVHTEVVANIKGRDEILIVIGSLAGLYYAIKYVYFPKITNLILSFLMFFIALMSKENAITFAAIVPMTLWVFTKADKLKIFIASLPVILASIIFLVIRTNVVGFLLSSGKKVTDLMNNPFVEMNFAEKYATITFTLGRYIKLLFFPHPLTHDYYPYQIPIQEWSNIAVLLALLVNLGLLVYGLVALKKKSIIGYSILFYFFTLSIVSNVLFEVGTFMNERFLFLPSIGFAIAIAWLLVEKLDKPKFINLIILGMIVVGFSFKTIERVPAWKNDYSLNKAAIKYSSGSARSNLFMGTAIFEKYKIEEDAELKDRYLDSVVYYVNKSVEIYPRYGSGAVMQSGTFAEEYKRDGDLDKLLSGYADLLSKKANLDFCATYLEYLARRVDRDKIEEFAFNTGYEVLCKKKHMFNYGIKYILIGLKAKPESKRLHKAAGEIYGLLGDKKKSDEHFQKGQ